MKQIQKILFPLDLASEYKTIIPWVRDLANKYNATVYILYVAQPVTYFPSFYINISTESFEAEMHVAAGKQMAAIVKDFCADSLKLETRVEIGRPAEKILECAEKEKIDLIIMGTHGRKGVERALFGSVAYKVVQAAPCPVLTIHP